MAENAKTTIEYLNEAARKSIWDARRYGLVGFLRPAAWSRANAGSLLREAGNLEGARRQYGLAVKYLLREERKNSTLALIAHDEAIRYLSKVKEIEIEMSRLPHQSRLI
jgi:hypothetical protein